MGEPGIKLEQKTREGDHQNHRASGVDNKPRGREGDISPKSKTNPSQGKPGKDFCATIKKWETIENRLRGDSEYRRIRGLA